MYSESIKILYIRQMTMIIPRISMKSLAKKGKISPKTKPISSLLLLLILSIVIYSLLHSLLLRKRHIDFS